jgi:hypothetical protein
MSLLCNDNGRKNERDKGMEGLNERKKIMKDTK